MAYSALKWCTPAKRPAAQKIQPIRFSGRRLAMTAPTVEKTNAPHVYSAQKEKMSRWERLRKRSTMLSAVSAEVSAQRDQASQAALRSVVLAFTCALLRTHTPVLK